MNITRAILELRIKYAAEDKLNPAAINSGNCKDFAAEIAAMGFGESVWGDDLAIEYWSKMVQDLCGEWNFAGYFSSIHCFIMYDGKFYDSETPQGCNYPDQLLCYQRNMNLLIDEEL